MLLFYVLIHHIFSYIPRDHHPTAQPTTPFPNYNTVVNNADSIPDSEGYGGKNFSSYNSASVNNKGLVVFRARSTGDHNPSTGIFVRDMLRGGSIVRQAGRRTFVPHPNNLTRNSLSSQAFQECPSMKITLQREAIMVLFGGLC